MRPERALVAMLCSKGVRELGKSWYPWRVSLARCLQTGGIIVGNIKVS